MHRVLPVLTVALTATMWAANAYDYSEVAAHCDDIYDFTGDAGFEAQTEVTNVTYIAANGTVPAYCSVSMVVETYTGVIMYLPAEGKEWKGVFASHGCGGSCGVVGMDYVYGYGSGPYGADLLERGYVSSMTDMGHKNSDYQNQTLSSWLAFRNNRTVEYNFAYYSTHLLAVSGKALTEFYYQKPIKYSIWRGGSTGGRQGLMIAQRFPHDYDAIIVGYAASNETGIGAIQFPYLAQVSSYANKTLILTATDVTSLHKGAVASCDANDGLIDGVVDPSYKCDFDPITILCSEGESSDCLSNMDKVSAARKMYSYPSNSKSSQLINSKYVPGSELEWSMWTSVSGWNFAESFTRDAAFQQDLPLNWTLDQYDWESYPYQLGPMEDIYGVGNGDLSIFRDKGGKILHYHGWADANVSPIWNLKYYQHVLKTMSDSVDSFYRLFMIPGMAHIDVGDSSTIAYRWDQYEYLENWYVNGTAPESLDIERYNLTAQATLDWRRVFPWPLVPKWEGKGEKGALTEGELNGWKGVEVSGKEASNY